MTGKFFRHQTKFEYLTHLWKKEKVRTIPALIKAIKKAEKEGILVVKRNKSKPDAVYEKNIRWYMGELERTGKIKGFLGPVGRPKGYSPKDKKKKK